MHLFIAAKTTVTYTDIPPTTTPTSVLPPAPTSKPKVPNLCEGSIDAASLIRGELFIFKGLVSSRFNYLTLIVKSKNFVSSFPFVIITSYPRTEHMRWAPFSDFLFSVCILLLFQYMWRLNERNSIHRGYPAYFHDFFMGFPWSVRSIDAVYQRPSDYHIIFFTGKAIRENSYIVRI